MCESNFTCNGFNLSISNSDLSDLCNPFDEEFFSTWFSHPLIFYFSLLVVVVVIVVVSFSSFKKSVPKFLTTFSLNFHSRLLVSRAIAFSHDKNDDESK